MRVLVGASTVLGMAMTAATVAVAQPPVRERAAEFKAPQALHPGDLPGVARGASDDLPTSPYLSSTPVPRAFPPTRSPGVAGPAPGVAGPSWLTGSDPNVRPATGIAPPGGTSGVSTLTPTMLPPDQAAPPVPPKMFDRMKGFMSTDRQPAPRQPAPRTTPQPVMQPEQPTATTPFRGTGANGAPVYAGPPAYRWYGWGTVTPGANPLAPAGQYPRASANWYAITGATPGAFPIPVSTPVRTVPGTEPPTYGLPRSQPGQQPVVYVAVQPQPHPQSMPPAPEYTEPSRYAPPVGSKFAAAPVDTPPPVSVPTLSTPPVAKPAAVPLPELPAPGGAGPASPAAPAQPGTETTTTLPPIPAIPTVEPVKPITPVPTAEPGRTPLPTIEQRPASPGPLPTSVMETPPREEMKWRRTTEPAPQQPGTWAPAPATTPRPTTESPAPSWQSGRAREAPVVARGQLNDNAPDAVATLVKQLCTGRADAVEVRWTGAKKLSVCFEIRTPAAAQKLVGEISKRPELAAYQIDFCVLVK
jgi:hypothetical protein